MAISRAWTDPDTLEWSASDVLRAADLNAMLGNQKWLHGRPRFTLVHSADQSGGATGDQTLTWDTEIEDVGGWYDAGSPTVVTVPETGRYSLKAHLLWDGTLGGTHRKARFAIDGNLARGTSAPGVGFAEHSLAAESSLSAGQTISVVVWHDDDDLDHDIINDSSPVWRSPIFMGTWLEPYSTDI